MPHDQPKKPQAQTPEIDADGLPDLTPKQMKFVEGVLSGMTATDAYLAAYDAADMARTTAQAEASRLRHRPEVEAWVRAGTIAHATSGILTKEQHIRELAAIKERAIACGDLKTAVAAEHLRGKASNLYTERIEVTHFEPAMTLAMMANLGLEGRKMAAGFARMFNLSVPEATALDPVAVPVSPLDEQPHGSHEGKVALGTVPQIARATAEDITET